MDTKIRIEYTFNSIVELLEFLKNSATGNIVPEVKVERPQENNVVDLRDILREINPDAINNADDDIGEK